MGVIFLVEFSGFFLRFGVRREVVVFVFKGELVFRVGDFGIVWG